VATSFWGELGWKLERRGGVKWDVRRERFRNKTGKNGEKNRLTIGKRVGKEAQEKSNH